LVDANTVELLLTEGLRILKAGGSYYNNPIVLAIAIFAGWGGGLARIYGQNIGSWRGWNPKTFSILYSEGGGRWKKALISLETKRLKPAEISAQVASNILSEINWQVPCQTRRPQKEILLLDWE